MGTVHKILSVTLRIFEFVCSAIILGLLAKFFHLIDIVHGPTDSRLVYAISMASISVALAIVLSLPLKYSFYLFPVDFALFICWIVCFALLEDLTGARTCSSSWFDTYWTVYWDANSGSSVVLTGSGCAKWRAVVAFSFIVSFFWLVSGFLGLYVCMGYYDLGSTSASFIRKFRSQKKPKDHDLETDAPFQEQRLPKVGNA